MISFSCNYQLMTINLWLLGFHSFILLYLWLHPGFLLPKDSGERLEANTRNFQSNSTVINEISPQSILASIIGFTLNGLVFILTLDSDHKPLAYWLPFISIVLSLPSPWLPIVRSQRLKIGSQH